MDGNVEPSRSLTEAFTLEYVQQALGEGAHVQAAAWEAHGHQAGGRIWSLPQGTVL